MMRQVKRNTGGENNATAVTTTNSNSVIVPYGAWTSSSIMLESASSSSSPLPFITSNACAESLTNFFQQDNDNNDNNFRLAVATEASSHPAGLQALYAQPWLWAGGGLGNMNECRHHAPHGMEMQNCLAGVGGMSSRESSSLIFASVCIVPECTAYDLASGDFPAILARAASHAATTSNRNADLAAEYVTIINRIHEINTFLGTGWTCGEFYMPWATNIWPFGVLFFVLTTIFLGATVAGTLWFKKTSTTSTTSTPTRVPVTPTLTPKRTKNETLFNSRTMSLSSDDDDDNNNDDDDDRSADTEEGDKTALLARQLVLEDVGLDEEKRQNDGNLLTTTPEHARPAASATLSTYASFFALFQSNFEKQQQQPQSCDYSPQQQQQQHWLSSCFDVTIHLKRLLQQSCRETAILDGLRVGSLLWIMLGHVMAIQSSSGAGYSNPAEFLPPFGLTTTVLGQLLFASRFAVDTFFIISGFLVVHVIDRKLPLQQRNNSNSSGNSSSGRSSNIWSNHISGTVLGRYLTNIFPLLLSRVARVLPLYAMCLLFYTQVAPHMGEGPFWYQWLALLKPCHDYGWTNVLFVNNFFPFDKPVTDTCFYHSWYLAVDMQLFVMASLLVFWYQANPVNGRRVTLSLIMASVVFTTHTALTRHWSVNTFDGAAVARYDMEAYANPLIRSQAYLIGMYMAMLLPMTTLRNRTPWNWRHKISLTVALIGMAVVTFSTAYGAYNRRPCQYQEWPSTSECGSEWSPQLTWIYTSACRPVWIAGVAIILHVCLGRNPASSIVASILSWKCWIPLSHLSFGAYLIHPIVIFIWQLGSREKQVFRLQTFGMDCISVMVVSYVSAMMATVTVEAPCDSLWKAWSTKTAFLSSQRGDSRGSDHSLLPSNDGARQRDLLDPYASCRATHFRLPQCNSYGSLQETVASSRTATPTTSVDNQH